jgi:hydrogenase expression/formation protein HypC
MCIAIPSKVVTIQQNSGIVEIAGVRRKISLMLVDDVQVGDYVMVHAGTAIHKIDEQTAIQTWNDLRRVIDAAPIQDK